MNIYAWHLESQKILIYYNWCHGTNCHTIETQSRIRGSGNNKVLRTIKIKSSQGKSMFGNGGGNIWDYFCNHRCLMDYVAKHTQEIINIAPRREALETPIKVEKVQNTDYYNNPYTTKRIEVLNE